MGRKLSVACQILPEEELGYKLGYKMSILGAWFYSLWMLAIGGITWRRGQFVGGAAKLLENGGSG